MAIVFNNSFDFAKFELLLSEDIQDYIYSKIIYNQPRDLLEDIRGYHKKIRVFSFASLCRSINNNIRFVQIASAPINSHTYATRRHIQRLALLQ